MLRNVGYQKRLPFDAVLRDAWYATQDLMLLIESLSKRYSCPLKDNRQGEDTGGERPDGRVDRWHGVRRNWPTASGSRAKAFPKATRCACAE